MRNIHLLPTYKPSRIHYYDHFSPLGLSKNYLQWKQGKNIYITNDEEIKVGDYWINLKFKDVDKCTHNGEVLTFNSENYQHVKKIILTTDQDLIKDGIQSIPDDFLEWFVKNPSCDWVEIIIYINDEYEWGDDGTNDSQHYFFKRQRYKIIIPKEKLKREFVGNTSKWNAEDFVKQETLEEAANDYSGCEEHRMDFIAGAKWQQERMYSELIKIWQDRQVKYENLAEKYKDNEHNFKKFTYKAMATRDCWKELLNELSK